MINRFKSIFSSVYYKQKSLDAEPIVFLDPNKMSIDGTIALHSMVFSEDGNFVAYSQSESGSDWETIKIRNVETGIDFEDVLQRTKFATISWTHNNNGFFYSVRMQN